MKAAVELKKVGVLVNMNMPFQRIGIPRMAMAMGQVQIEKESKWSWMVFHKGEWEMVVWNDGTVVYWLGNSCRAKRLGILKRSMPGGTEVFFVETPEAPWAFNTFGRSGVDGQDQGRKEQQTSARRTQRAGTKGALFGVDVALTNMWIEKKHLQVASGLLQYRSETITKNDFLSDIANHTLSTVTSRRRSSKQCGCKRAWDNVEPVFLLENGNALGHHILVAPQEAAMTEW
jgi:hypothetical protein